MPRFRRDQPGGGAMMAYITIIVLALIVAYVILLVVLPIGTYHFLRDRGCDEGQARAAAATVFALLLCPIILPGC